MGDSDRYAFEGPAAVLFQVELALEGVVCGLDELANLLEHRLAVSLLLPLVRRPQQLDALLGRSRLNGLEAKPLSEISTVPLRSATR